ncbi:MAG: DUF1648 domain-containing protein [Coriobacteriia bacterium]|nr:DUF1648 domain-containing protein [Coriobacteriia bacterium]MBS5477918.1 DUF1648 domain-containing protein [Coriobacteriia bacterium]
MVTALVLTLVNVLVGALLAATPWLMPRQECFAVTVPPCAHTDPRIARMKCVYTLAVVLTTLVGAAASFAGFALGGEPAFMVAWTAALVVLVVAPFALMLWCRSRVRRIKQEEGWAPSSELSAAILAEGDLPAPVPLAWQLLGLVPVVLGLILMAVLWDDIPDRVPMHADLEGNVNDWADKGPGIVLFPVLTQLFIWGAIVVSHWLISRSRRPVDPRRPLSSALSYALFARAMGWCLVETSVVINAMLLAFPLSSAGVITLGQAGIIMMVALVPVLVPLIVVAIIYGQSGARVLSRMSSEDSEMSCDEDRYWKLGLLYVNRDDESLFVPERFGVGWTVNFGRPAAWALLIGFLVVTVAFVVAVFLLV